MASRPDTNLRDLVASSSLVGLVVCVVVLQMCGDRRPKDADEKCLALLDRFVELRVRDANPKASDYLIEQRQAEARVQAKRVNVLELCRDRLTDVSAACAEKATNADDLERCLL